MDLKIILLILAAQHREKTFLQKWRAAMQLIIMKPYNLPGFSWRLIKAPDRYMHLPFAEIFLPSLQVSVSFY